MRLAAVQRSYPLAGESLVTSWRERADRYPDQLVVAMVERSLNPQVLTGWAAREAMARRGDDLAARALLSRISYAVAGTVLALNRLHLPHRQLKWHGSPAVRARGDSPTGSPSASASSSPPGPPTRSRRPRTCWPTQWPSPQPAPKPT